MGFEKAYDDLSNIMDKYRMSYIHVKSDEMVSITRVMSNYIDSVNAMNESYFIMKKDMIYHMWERCHSYIPVIFGFPPSVAMHSSEKLSGILESYLVFEHLYGSRVEQQQILKLLKDTVDKAILFIRRHSTAERNESFNQVLRIISSYQVSLKNSSDALKYSNKYGFLNMFSIK